MLLKVELEPKGLLHSLANNTPDPNFLAALENADKAKANSNADYITLFLQEYRKLEPSRPLAILFVAASNNRIDIRSGDTEVEDYIRNEFNDAFDRTFRVLSNRAELLVTEKPWITADRNNGVINFELTGVTDKERVRKYLASAANLQFWEVYSLQDPVYSTGWQKTITDFNKKQGVVADTVIKTPGINKKDSGLAAELALSEEEIPNKSNAIEKYIQFIQPYRDENNYTRYPAAIGYVAIGDTAEFRQFLAQFSSNFPADIIWAYGIPEKDNKGHIRNEVPLYALRTYGRTQAKLEGDAIADARVDLDPYGRVEIRMNMKRFGQNIWAKMTEQNVGKPIAIVLDNIVYSAPIVINPIPDGTSSISGGFTGMEAQDLANILKAGKVPLHPRIIEEKIIEPSQK